MSKNIKQIIIKTLPQPIKSLLLSIKYFGKKVPQYKLYQSYLKGKKGIEIGGPSRLFETTLPVYQVVESLDGVNFAGQTIWEGKIQAGGIYSYYGSKKGTQYISDATDLSGIESDSYDFLLSSNCLEHVANPLKAMAEWKRVLRDGAALVLVLPNKSCNFDHNRPVTTFQHLKDDYVSKTTESDLTHLEEILALHDLSMDPPAGDLENFRKRSLDNFHNRTLHHHVFDEKLIREVLDHFSFEVIDVSSTETDFLAIGLKKS